MVAKPSRVQVQIAVRVPREWIEELDEIAERLTPGEGMSLSRADAIRMCIARGKSSYIDEFNERRRKR